MSFNPFRLLEWSTARMAKAPAGSEESAALATLLASHPLFKDVDPVKLAQAVPAVRFKEFKDEEIVCHCPDAVHDGFLLLSGVVAVTRKNGNMLHTVQLEEPGSLFNLGALLGLERHPEGARALGQVKVLAIDSAMLRQQLLQDPQWGLELVCQLSALALDQCEQALDSVFGLIETEVSERG